MFKFVSNFVSFQIFLLVNNGFADSSRSSGHQTNFIQKHFLLLNLKIRMNSFCQRKIQYCYLFLRVHTLWLDQQWSCRANSIGKKNFHEIWEHFQMDFQHIDNLECKQSLRNHLWVELVDILLWLNSNLVSRYMNILRWWLS